METSKVLFADAKLEVLEQNKTLPAKFVRLFKELKLNNKLKGKEVGIKIHFGWGLNYTTIHPVFISALVKEIKAAGARTVKLMDDTAQNGIGRGYTREIVGCPVVCTFGETWKYGYKEKIGYETLDEVKFSGEALECDYLINLSHVKGHGDCGFGGAIKNIAMGLVDDPARRKLHRLEGGLAYNKKKCTLCLKCVKACRRQAISYDKKNKEMKIFFHHCTYCQHCLLECPKGAITMNERNFDKFAKGMALVTNAFLKRFKPENVTYINFLTNITVYCDCWGFSSPSLVPDIGILGSDNICAIDTASLDMIKTENLIENGLPKNRKLLDNNGHLFERIHGKNPYLMVNHLSKYSGFKTGYKIVEVK
ncbi:MAG: hypothetical protein A2252_05345 [Elusimicrobia bacterium RIFOXYA2_FULL_39_19]|nr:MAG: hypothetical protein A2252_05345 [Elusimicrobia bacterium RIFOXYA2_FULL_39_19]